MNKPKQDLLAIWYTQVSCLAYPSILKKEAMLIRNVGLLSTDYMVLYPTAVKTSNHNNIVLFYGDANYETSTDGIPVILTEIFRA
jgi:hypothetical protein